MPTSREHGPSTVAPVRSPRDGAADVGAADLAVKALRPSPSPRPMMKS
jgi:hypothetical protein